MVKTIRVLAAFFALLWAVLGFGLVDLWVTINPSPVWLWVSVLDGGWGLFVTFLIAAGLGLVVVRPCWAHEVAAQLLALAALVTISGVLGDEAAVWWMVLALVVPGGLLAGLATLHRRRAAIAPGPSAPRFQVAWPLGGLALVGAVPWLVYAADMYAANRALRWPNEITNNVNHWAIQGAFAVALVLFTALAAVRPTLRRFNAVRVGICAAYLGVCSLRFSVAPAALPTLWAVLAICWGVLLAAVAIVLGSRAEDPAPR
jgi:hypothetical protein